MAGAIVGVGVVVVVAALYLRARYDVIGVVHTTALDWASIHTDWLIASPTEIDDQIAAARESWPFPAFRQGPAAGPLRVLPANPRYFTDGSGRAVYLAGSHTWSDFQDSGGSNPPPTFDYDRFLDFLEAHHHNFFRLWVWENSRWTLETPDENYWFDPGPPFRRTGPGTALDGMPRWDLTRFDSTYFDRLRRRVVAAGRRGIYVSVMLFDGWSVASRKGPVAAGNPWHGSPFNRANNVNGIDGDADGDDSGVEVHELKDPRVLGIQEAYVRRVIDAVGDLDNVLYEVCNECSASSTAWQYHMIDFVKKCEQGRPMQHPVGMTVEWPHGDNEELFASDADWISPESYADPPASRGRKVIIADTDHIWGIGGDRKWAWESFTRGLNLAFMDGYDGAGYGVGGLGFDLDAPKWVSLRRNLGYIRAYARRMDLAGSRPRPDMCSTTYCLAVTGNHRPEYLVYAPDGGDLTVDLSSAPEHLSVEWFDPGTADVHPGGTVVGGAERTFSAPFRGDAVLYLEGIPGAGAR